MVSFSFWQKWLFLVCSCTVALGIFLALISWWPVFDPLNNSLIYSVFWTGVGPDASSIRFAMWMYGLFGGTMAGWGLTLAFIINGPFIKREKWSRDAFAAGATLWFVVDTFMSIYTRAYFNVGVNISFVIFMGLPLLATWNEFKSNTS